MNCCASSSGRSRVVNSGRDAGVAGAGAAWPSGFWGCQAAAVACCDPVTGCYCCAALLDLQHREKQQV
jgi:hypothetical protein